MSERLIATVRIVLAAAALLVVWVDPTQPSVDVPIAYASFVAYLLYSVVVLVVVRAGPRPELPLVTQVLDLVWLAPTLYLTEGANSPFFVFFVVFAFTAAIRWGLRVFWVVTLVCLASYASLLLLSTPTPLDLNNYLMRPAHFLIVGVLGGYLVEYRRRREAELGMLNEAAAAIGTAHGAATAMGLVVEAIARHGLGQIALGCLLDPETEELVLVRGPGEIRRLDDDEAAPFTAALAGAHGEGEARSRALLPVAPALRRLVGADDGVLYPVRVGQRLVGAILVFGRPPRRSAVSGDFLALLLRHVTPHVETLYLLERAREHHVVEERRRIARDLHDSFIQVLAGLGFRLHALAVHAAGGRDAKLPQELGELRATVSAELERVRAYLVAMREPTPHAGDLGVAVREATDAFRARTGIPLEVSVDPSVSAVPAETVRELGPLLREALTNVEKHARATRVAVTARVEQGQLRLSVSDDGRGIGEAVLTAAAEPLRGRGQGLLSMRERARLVGGTLAIGRSQPRGTTVELSVPLASAPDRQAVHRAPG